MNENKPLISICMVTYNHEPYIAQAIESVMMQKTNFQVELVIGEDGSSDNTREICLKYKEKYPDTIKLLLSDVNLGIKKNVIQTLHACSGKYIAQCDGDDFWTDPDKLQKQADILETNEEYCICMHTCTHYYENSGSIEKINTPSYLTDRNKGFSFTYIDRANEWFGATLTWLYRKDRLPDKQKMLRFDMFIDLHMLYYIMKDNGIGYYLEDDMATYRIHSDGVWSGLNKEKQLKQDVAYYGQIYLFEKEKTSNYMIQKAIYKMLYFYFKEKKYAKCFLSFLKLGYTYGYKNCFFRFSKTLIQ